jgi:hypothetical protein
MATRKRRRRGTLRSAAHKRPRSSGDRALASGARCRRFESCRGHCRRRRAVADWRRAQAQCVLNSVVGQKARGSERQAEDLLKSGYVGPFDRFQGKCSTRRFLHARLAKVRVTTGRDQAKQGEIYGDVQGGPVAGHTSLTPQSDRGQLVSGQVYAWATQQTPCAQPIGTEYKQQDLFQLVDVGAQIMTRNREDGIAHQLPGSVQCALTAAFGSHDGDRTALGLRRVEQIAQSRSFAQGYHRLVFQEQEHAFDGASCNVSAKTALEFLYRAIRDQTEIEDRQGPSEMPALRVAALNGVWLHQLSLDLAMSAGRVRQAVHR